MKKYLAITAVLLLGLAICFIAKNAVAEKDGDMEYSWGVVKNVSPGKIELKEYDYDQDSEVDVVYTLDPEVTLENLASIQDLKADDNVEVDYVMENEQKIIKALTLEGASETAKASGPACKAEMNIASEEIEEEE